MPADEKSSERGGAIVETREISIALDNYDDLFSDFDPRAYSLRQVSEDFLRELERINLEGEKGEIAVRFYIKKENRKESSEEQIIKRLQSYFRWKAKELKKDEMSIGGKGVKFLAIGIVIMLVQAYFVEFKVYPPAAPLLDVLFVPFGWFAVWVGLEKLFEGREEAKKQGEKAGRLARAKYSFTSKEETEQKEA